MSEINTLKIDEVITKPVGSPAYMNHQLRRKLAPFVLFDAGLVPMNELMVDWHPHSGVATISLPYEGVIYHNDSTRLFSEITNDQHAVNNEKAIQAGGVQWMASGNGIWHRERGTKVNNKLGLIQSWLLLPPGSDKNQENGNPSYHDLQDNEISQVTDENQTRTKVLIGEFEQGGKSVKGNLVERDDVHYFYVHIKKGQTWNFKTPDEFKHGFVFVPKGSVTVNGQEVDTEQLAVWFENSGEVTIQANEDSEFAIGVAKPWPHKMVVHYGQVHSSKENLESGSNEINRIGSALKKVLS